MSNFQGKPVTLQWPVILLPADAVAVVTLCYLCRSDRRQVTHAVPWQCTRGVRGGTTATERDAIRRRWVRQKCINCPSILIFLVFVSPVLAFLVFIKFRSYSYFCVCFFATNQSAANILMPHILLLISKRCGFCHHLLRSAAKLKNAANYKSLRFSKCHQFK